MTDIATRIEPMPTVSEGPACWDVAIERIRDHKYGGGYCSALVRFAAGRDEFGTAKYKTRLRPNDGRSSLIDALQEGLDKLVYLVKAEMEDIDVSDLIEDEIRAMIRLAGVLDARGILWDGAKKQPNASGAQARTDDPSIEIAARAIRDIGPCAAFAELNRIYNRSPAQRAARRVVDGPMVLGDESDVEHGVPGSVVTASRLNHGLRVGMTYQEVRDNKWTECEAQSFEHPAACTDGDPCSACKFLDGALCACGHPFSWHFPSNCGLCQSVGCSAFSLASWTPEPSDEERTAVPPMTDTQRKARAECKGDPCSCDWQAPHGRDPFTECDPSEEIRTQSNERNALLAAESAQTKKETDMTDTNTKKPRINRARWHETEHGAKVIAATMASFKTEPIHAWYARELGSFYASSLGKITRSDVDLALDHLISTGAIVQHGKAKGTRYAVAGFTDWPAPTPRKVSASVALTPAGITAADAAHSLDASDSEET